jgi:hypothetical protein
VILALSKLEVMNDALQVMGLRVASRMGVPPGAIRAKWGKMEDGTLVPVFTVVTEHGNITSQEIYSKSKDLYASMGMMLKHVFEGLGTKRSDVQKEVKIWLN